MPNDQQSQSSPPPTYEQATQGSMTYNLIPGKKYVTQFSQQQRTQLFA